MRNTHGVSNGHRCWRLIMVNRQRHWSVRCAELAQYRDVVLIRTVETGVRWEALRQTPSDDGIVRADDHHASNLIFLIVTHAVN